MCENSIYMKKIYLLLLLATIFVACKKDRDVEFTTFEIENEKLVPSYTSTNISCKVRCVATINELYLQYDTTANFSTYQEILLSVNEKTEVYSAKISDLQDNTTYYVRYVAVNSFSQVTSEKISKFQTLQATVPTIEVVGITNVLDTIASAEIKLLFDGGTEVTKIGICWGTDSMLTIENNYVEMEDVQSLLNIGGLESNITYYVRAYAENKMGIAYSDSKSFITLALPVVQTGEITDVQFSAVLNGVALFDGNDPATIYGFCWSEDENPTIENQSVVVSIDENSMFTYRLVDLQSRTKYYIRAYAQNKIGIVYGDVKDFTTADIPTIEYDYVCEGYEYVGFGFRTAIGEITADTVLYRTVKTIEGCDSFIGLYIDFVPTAYVDTTVSIIEGEYYEFGEKTLTKAGVYKETFVTSLGCDSIVNLTLIVKPGVDGHEYVDLGLSVKWATCNVGANKPEEYGDYFAWGETAPKEYYDWSTYKYCNGSGFTFTKYCNDSSCGYNGFTDNKTILDPEDDAATANWGGAWRMPTKAELDELCNSCTWTWIDQNGVFGSKVVGKNGNSIFLPCAGYVYDGSSDLRMGEYWSSTLHIYPYYAYIVYFLGSITGQSSYAFRNEGRSIRPVYGELVQQPATKQYIISVYSIEDSYGIVSGGGTYDEGSLVTITATAKSGYKFTEWNDGNTDNPRIVTVTKDAIYTAHFEKNNMNAGHEYVDLGLSVKWATCNVGATKPEEYGDYFAWGEVEPKEHYDWSTYKFGSRYNLFKYCHDSYGSVDNK